MSNTALVLGYAETPTFVISDNDTIEITAQVNIQDTFSNVVSILNKSDAPDLGFEFIVASGLLLFGVSADGSTPQTLQAPRFLPYGQFKGWIKIIFTPSTGVADFSYANFLKLGPYYSLGNDSISPLTLNLNTVSWHVGAPHIDTDDNKLGIDGHLGAILEVELKVNDIIVLSPTFKGEVFGTTEFDDAQGNTWTCTNALEVTTDRLTLREIEPLSVARRYTRVPDTVLRANNRAIDTYTAPWTEADRTWTPEIIDSSGNIQNLGTGSDKEGFYKILPGGLVVGYFIFRVGSGSSFGITDLYITLPEPAQLNWFNNFVEDFNDPNIIVGTMYMRDNSSTNNTQLTILELRFPNSFQSVGARMGGNAFIGDRWRGNVPFTPAEGDRFSGKFMYRLAISL